LLETRLLFGVGDTDSVTVVEFDRVGLVPLLREDAAFWVMEIVTDTFGLRDPVVVDPVKDEVDESERLVEFDAVTEMEFERLGLVPLLSDDVGL